MKLTNAPQLLAETELIIDGKSHKCYEIFKIKLLYIKVTKNYALQV